MDEEVETPEDALDFSIPLVEDDETDPFALEPGEELDFGV